MRKKGGGVLTAHEPASSKLVDRHSFRLKIGREVEKEPSEKKMGENKAPKELQHFNSKEN